VNVYLYQVLPNTALRNADLPTRDGSGRLLRRPSAALDLHYLFTFYGDQSEHQIDLAMAVVAQRLHAEPALDRAIVAAASSGPLADSDLADAPDLIRFSPSVLSLEEMSKLWSVMLQTAYVPSMAYVGRVVLVDADVPIKAPLPVRAPPDKTTLIAFPFSEPVIERVLSRASPADEILDQPIFAGYELSLEGSDLASPSTKVRFQTGEVAVAPLDASRIVVALPSTLRAGPHTVQVVHEMDVGDPPSARIAAESRAALFLLRPQATFDIEQPASSSDPHVVSIENLSPEVGSRQRVILLLNRLNPPPDAAVLSYAFPVPVDDTPSSFAELSVELAGVEPGDYLVRVQVDGAESVLGFDATTLRYDDPTLTFDPPP
jgi:hypothetical protein